MNRLKVTACATLAAFMLTACNNEVGQRESMEKTITQDEAAEKINQHVTDAMAALPETVELEPLGPVAFASCDDPTDGGSKNRVTVSQRHWITGIPAEDNDQNADLLHDYWTTNGYRIIRDERPEKMSISVESEEDAFKISLRVSAQGDLSIGASSPCVWPEGTPNP
jgi:hypothetical protein